MLIQRSIHLMTDIAVQLQHYPVMRNKVISTQEEKPIGKNIVRLAFFYKLTMLHAGSFYDKGKTICVDPTVHGYDSHVCTIQDAALFTNNHSKPLFYLYDVKRRFNLKQLYGYYPKKNDFNAGVAPSYISTDAQQLSVSPKTQTTTYTAKQIRQPLNHTTATNQQMHASKNTGPCAQKSRKHARTNHSAQREHIQQSKRSRTTHVIAQQSAVLNSEGV